MTVNAPVQTGGVLVMGVAAMKVGADAVRGLPATGARAIVEAGSHAREIALAVGGLSLAAMALIRGGKHVELTAGRDLDDDVTV